MKQRNCPNCGAPYEVDLNKCPYCNTSYYDLSALDFTKREPFYLKIKVDMNGHPCYITQLVRPNADITLTCSSETVDVYSPMGHNVATYNTDYSITTDISFDAVCDGKHKEIMTIQME